MALLIVGLVLFVGIHSTAIFGIRDRAVASMGEGPWKGLYSVISLVGLALVIWGYGEARTEPTVLWAPPIFTRHLALTLMIPVFPLLLAAYLPGRIQRAVGHPMMLAAILWGVSHLLANGALRDVVLFGGLLAWALVDFASLRSRPRRAILGAPPSAINDGIAVIGGLVLYGLFLGGLHTWLFGVPPIAR